MIIIERPRLRVELSYNANYIFITDFYSIHGKVLIAFYDKTYSVKKSMYFLVHSGFTALLAAMSGPMAVSICKLQFSCHLPDPIFVLPLNVESNIFELNHDTLLRRLPYC